MHTLSDQDMYRARIKDCIMERLYLPQLKFWNHMLEELARENADSYGRSPTESYAVFYKNKRWNPQAIDWTDTEKAAYCLPLNPNIPDLEKRMAEIAEEFEELETEKYEAERFLSNIVLFSAPPARYRDILGETLYGFVRKEVEAFCPGVEDKDWNMNNEHSMKAYVEENQSIIRAMNERVLVNLVTL